MRLAPFLVFAVDIVTNPCMRGGRGRGYVCMYVRGGLESRQRSDESGTGRRERERRVTEREMEC